MCFIKRMLLGVAWLVSTTCISVGVAATNKSSDVQLIDQGRYLVKITGCNDCHTPGYTQLDGKVPEKLWLTGDKLGWHGPWGTTYASNLRLFMQTQTEAQWLNTARTAKYRPPMPWFALHAMKEADLKAIYRFIRYLGPAGEAAPAYQLPDQEPQGEFVLFPNPHK